MLFCVLEMDLPEMSMKWQGLEGGNVTGYSYFGERSTFCVCGECRAERQIKSGWDDECV